MDLIENINQFSALISSVQCKRLNASLSVVEAMDTAFNKLLAMRNKNGTVFIIGNGGSAAIASHIIVDFINVGKLKSQVLHESSLLTCMANDYGYEAAYARVLNNVFQKDDILIAISSSGKSENICNAVKVAKEKQGEVITFSGFSMDNPLMALGDINFWLDSSHYGLVEVGHLFMLHNLADRFRKVL